MDVQSIKTEKEYEDLLNWIDKQFDLGVLPDSEQGQKLQIALLVIKQYEDLTYVIPFPDPCGLEFVSNK